MISKMQASDWIKTLGLKKHPEGGYFKETYRSSLKVSGLGFDDQRSACTLIYYLLKGDQFSAFHRLKSDELWHFHYGSPLLIHIIEGESGEYHTKQIGRGRQSCLQAIIKAGNWFSASVKKSREDSSCFSLVSCFVAPGFDLRDWELAKKSKLIAMYPQHRSVIERWTRE